MSAVARGGRTILPPDECPRCLSKRILGPRVVKDKQKWGNCYDCGHEWQVDKPRVRKGHKPSRNPKVSAAET